MPRNRSIQLPKQPKYCSIILEGRDLLGDFRATKLLYCLKDYLERKASYAEAAEVAEDIVIPNPIFRALFAAL